MSVFEISFERYSFNDGISIISETFMPFSIATERISAILALTKNDDSVEDGQYGKEPSGSCDFFHSESSSKINLSMSFISDFKLKTEM